MHTLTTHEYVPSTEFEEARLSDWENMRIRFISCQSHLWPLKRIGTSFFFLYPVFKQQLQLYPLYYL